MSRVVKMYSLAAAAVATADKSGTYVEVSLELRGYVGCCDRGFLSPALLCIPPKSLTASFWKA